MQLVIKTAPFDVRALPRRCCHRLTSESSVPRSVGADGGTRLDTRVKALRAKETADISVSERWYLRDGLPELDWLP
jgi:hypothetical protein